MEMELRTNVTCIVPANELICECEAVMCGCCIVVTVAVAVADACLVHLHSFLHPSSQIPKHRQTDNQVNRAIMEIEQCLSHV